MAPACTLCHSSTGCGLDTAQAEIKSLLLCVNYTARKKTLSVPAAPPCPFGRGSQPIARHQDTTGSLPTICCH
jgi:hypothetical protein